MKKVIVLCALFASFIGCCFGIENYFSVGLGVYKDGSRAFIIDVVPNSPSSRANINIGSEILEIGGEKTRRLNINAINNLLAGAENSTVDLVIKDRNKTNYTLKREKIEDTRVVLDDEFLKYWSKISPKKYVYANTLFVSPKYSDALRLEIRVNNYWVDKRKEFNNKYNMCKNISEEWGVCMEDAVMTTKSQIQKEQTSLFEEEKNQRIIKETVREIEMNLDEQDFQNQMMKMHLGI